MRQLNNFMTYTDIKKCLTGKDIELVKLYNFITENIFLSVAVVKLSSCL